MLCWQKIMSKVFTVRLNGHPIKDFTDHLAAKKFMVDLQVNQLEKVKQMALIDEAVLLSGLVEANQVIKRIMEMRYDY